MSAASLCLVIRKTWLVEIVWVIDLFDAPANIPTRVDLNVIAMAAALPVMVDIVAHAYERCIS